MSDASEALTFFLDDDRMATVDDDPDTGIDMAEELTDDEWRTVANEYRGRDARWRRSAVYLAGVRPLVHSGLVIRHGLRDPDVDTLEVTLLAVSASILDTGGVLTPPDARLVLDAIPRLPHASQQWEEIIELGDLAASTVGP